MTTHARKRLAERGIPDAILRRIPIPLRGSVAIRLRRLPRVVGAWCGSQGDWEWAIIRDGALVTVFRRRSNQPSTPQALGVNRVVYAM